MPNAPSPKAKRQAVKAAKPLKLAKGEALVLRTSNLDGSSYNGFVWPKSGPVTCPDWKPRAQCGNGLHGLLWGVGDGSYLNWGEAAWLVVRVKLDEIVQIDGDKVKFPSGVVEYFGERQGALALVQQFAPAGSVIVGAPATAGYGGTATAGYGGTATAGDGGTATAGDGGTATAGYRGTATAGYGGTATAGDGGTATAEDGGTATAGYRGTATAGDGGTATAGYGGAIAIFYWNGEKYRRAVFEAGEGLIQANTPYRLDKNGQPVEVKKEAQ